MELRDAMRSMHACRFFTPDPVPDAVFHRAVEAAQFAPNGGNRQGVRFAASSATRRRSGGSRCCTSPPWREVSGAARAGLQAITTESGVEKSGTARLLEHPKALDEGDHFAEHFGEHPVIVVVMDRNEMHPTDTELDRLSIVGGASVYPMTQLLPLPARAVRDELHDAARRVRAGGQGAARHPRRVHHRVPHRGGLSGAALPTRLPGRPVEELAFVDSFGSSLTLSVSSCARPARAATRRRSRSLLGGSPTRTAS